MAVSTVALTQVPPQIGRLPILAGLPAKEGQCSVADPTDDLQKAGVIRVIMFQGGEPQRLIGVGADTRGRPRSLLILSSAPAGERRREGESLQATFDASGRVTSGLRRYFTTGNLSRRSDDRNYGLLAQDTAQIPVLARAVIARCGR
ncbi:MAG: hypothetical protein FJ363_01870 [Gemmatimonadetes bacterium]|nr:hypothetical protein [Gemmatimonadota bacterium]